MSCGRPLEIVIFWTVAIFVYRNVEAGPVKRPSRMVREVYPEIDPENEGNQAQVCIVGDVVYGTDETVPAEQPCLKCKCQPPGVQCETLQCEKRPGCKAIHKSNRCCPEYQCECEHNGKFYANGEKLETPPGGECKVCYCRGGEVQCTEVSCYIRNDCEGKGVTGQCCPKYDHCPPIDPVPSRPLYSTEITVATPDKGILDHWPAVSNVTDNILIPSNDIQDLDTSEATTPIYKPTETGDLQKDAAGIHKITIQEIIPERKEIPVTSPPKEELESQGTLVIEEADEFLNHSNDLVTDSDADSSEISEVFQHPPPVLRIGDKLLFLKKGEFVSEKDGTTPNSVITIVGAEGLQRGFEESGEIHEVKIEHVAGDNSTKETESTIPTIQEKIDNDSAPDDNTYPNNDTELNTAYSTHILSLVKRKRKPASSTTELPTSSSTTEHPTSASTTEAQSSASTIEPSTSTSTKESQTLMPTIETTTTSSTTTQIATNDSLSSTDDTLILTTPYYLSSSTTEEGSNTKETILIIDAENFTVPKETDSVQSSTSSYDLLDQNPAYPPLPDIMSPHHDDPSRSDIDPTDNENTTDRVLTLKISPEVLDKRSNKTVSVNSTNSEWLKNNSVVNYQAMLPDDVLNQPVPSDFMDVTETINDAITSTTETISEAPATTVTMGTDIYPETTDSILDTTTSDFVEDTGDISKSVESLESADKDSGETTTKKDSHAPILSNENASIEEKHPNSSEAEDMVSVNDGASNDSGEETTPSPSDMGMIDKEWQDKEKNNTNANRKDVEIIDTKSLGKKPAIERVMESTTENGIENNTSKVIEKRESSSSDQKLLKELYKELDAEIADSEEERKESDVVFKELLEGTTPKTVTDVIEPRNKESEASPRVSKALTSSGSKEPDSGVFQTLLKFFNSQYPYSKK